MMVDRLDIRNILISDWDPLDISENRKLHDEYDKVVDNILSVDLKFGYETEIYNLLLAAETEFEIDPINRDRIHRVAHSVAQLVNLK